MWIDTFLKKPSSPFEYVLVTDGRAVWLANWIEDPLDWYGDEEICKIGDDFRDPHWLFDLRDHCIGPFINGDNLVFYPEFEVSHWMPLPNPPLC